MAANMAAAAASPTTMQQRAPVFHLLFKPYTDEGAAFSMGEHSFFVRAGRTDTVLGRQAAHTMETGAAKDGGAEGKPSGCGEAARLLLNDPAPPACLSDALDISDPAVDDVFVSGQNFHLVLRSKVVSRTHARIEWHSNPSGSLVPYLCDQSSTHGTYHVSSSEYRDHCLSGHATISKLLEKNSGADYQVHPGAPRLLLDGDIVVFGKGVVKDGSKIFAPAAYVVSTFLVLTYREASEVC